MNNFYSQILHIPNATGIAARIQPYTTTGKELDTHYSLNWLNFGARQYMPDLGQWNRVDDLCEKYYPTGPYVYCGANPVKYIDPTGMFLDDIYYNEAGKEIYRVEREGVDRNFVIKTSQTTSEMYIYSNSKQRGFSTPISINAAHETEKQIRNGNIIGPHMRNVTELPNTNIINAMLNAIKDDGTGGTSISNNREYSGKFTAFGIRNLKKGAVGDPSRGRALTSTSYGKIDFHSHASGEKRKNGILYGWQQPPTKQDISSAIGDEYVIGMDSGLIYKYNQYGVFATIPFAVFK